MAEWKECTMDGCDRPTKYEFCRNCNELDILRATRSTPIESTDMDTGKKRVNPKDLAE